MTLKLRKYSLRVLQKNFFKEHFSSYVLLNGKSLTIDVLADNGKIIQAIPRIWYNGKLEKKIIQKVFYSKIFLELVNLINSKYQIAWIIRY